jgi:hypothetical protein
VTTKEATCAQRIDNEMQEREEQIKALLSNPDSDWIQDDPALSIDRREVFTICLSWGGPADYIEVTTNDGEIEKMIYRFSDWFDTATREIEEDSSLWEYARNQVEMMRGDY